MSVFDKRRDAFDEKFACERDLRICATASRNRPFGLWAASLTGKIGDSAEACAKSVVGGVLLGCAIATSATAQSEQRGETLARKWCASCHIVAPYQKTAQDGVPSFDRIARSPHLAGKRLASFLLNQHPGMPGVVLSRREARDLAAYIKSKETR
jgi:mono/diheme cytochrome c family protein